ncbi:MAG TPA: GAF domain-containing SpoIIE family protein phosphatase [Anaerolineales bacterium]|nr:GAF domain-containing SpoIIE family protein phosphatase [Anaerolineales bacterium]
MSLSEDRLSLLYRVSQTFNSSLDLSEVLNRVMDEVIAATRAERGFLVLRQDDGSFRFGAARGLDQSTVEAPEFQVSRGIVDRVAAQGKPLLTSDAQTDAWLASRDSVRIVGVRAILCVPLALKGRTEGVIYVDSRLQAGVFSPDDVAMLEGIGASAAIAIENARLYQVAVEKGRMERELQVAREVQSSLLPQDLPNLAGWQFASWWQPAREVSGDFYDFAPFRDGSLALVIGDVTDKGMPAALFMATARSVVRACIAAAYEPGLAVEQANAELAAEAPNGMFVTLLVAQLNHNHGSVRVVNAGNNRPILYRASADKLVDLGAPGLPLGIDPGQAYQTSEELLLDGDFLLLHTDGLTDANDASQSLFGMDRLRAALLQHRSTPAPDLRDRLRQAVDNFIGAVPPYDDVTFLIARRTT